MEAISLKGAGFVIRIYCQGAKVPSPTQMPGRGGAKWSQDPHFLQQWLLCVKGARCQGNCWGNCPPPSITGPRAFGEFQTGTGGRKRTSPSDPRHLLGVLVKEIAERDTLRSCLTDAKGSPDDIRAEPSRGDTV